MTIKQLNEIERILKEGGYVERNRIKNKEDCQYRGNDEKYCHATQQNSCSMCKFYTPTLHAKNRMLMEEIVRHEKAEKKKDKEFRDAKNELARVNSELQYEIMARETEAEVYERELRRAEMTREFIRKFWGGTQYA